MLLFDTILLELNNWCNMFQVHSIFCSKNVTKNFLTQSSCFCYALCCLLCTDCKRSKRLCSRVCVRVCEFHYQRVSLHHSFYFHCCYFTSMQQLKDCSA